MKNLPFIFLLACVLLLELVVTAALTFRTVNLAKYPYRREERYAALKAWEADRSPEKDAAYREELRLASHHATGAQLGKAGVIFLAFLVVDGVFIYTSRYGRERQQVV